MAEDKDKFYLEHILEAIENIDSFMFKKTKNDLLHDKLLQSAVIRQLEIVGEATKRVSQEKKEKSPQTEWKDIAGFRDVLIHDYFGIDMESVWNTVNVDVPALKKDIQMLLDKI